MNTILSSSTDSLIAQLIDISDDGFATLMSDKGDTRGDLRLPDGELGKTIKDAFEADAGSVIVSIGLLREFTPQY